MSDHSELKKLAEACGDLNWRAIQENWTELAIRDDHGYIATMRTKSGKHAGPCPDRESKAKFLCAVTPVAVLALIAEVEGFRAQHGRDSAELRSLCQARDDARKERDQLKAEVEALRKDIAALKPSPIRTDKTTIGYTGCVICGQYTDHGGLQCPNLAFRSLSMGPPTKPVPPAPILMSVHGYPVDEDGKYIERKEVKP